MTTQEANELRNQIARQTAELATYAAAITDAQVALDAKNAAAQPARDIVAQLTEQLAAEQKKIDDAQPDISKAQSLVDGLTSNADAITQAVALCQELLKQPIDDSQPIQLFAVSRKAIKVALSDAGLLESFEATVSNPLDSAGKMALISWEEDDSFTKDSPVMVLVLGRMTLTDAQKTALFVAAASL